MVTFCSCANESLGVGGRLCGLFIENVDALTVWKFRLSCSAQSTPSLVFWGRVSGCFFDLGRALGSG